MIQYNICFYSIGVFYTFLSFGHSPPLLLSPSLSPYAWPTGSMPSVVDLLESATRWLLTLVPAPIMEFTGAVGPLPPVVKTDIIDGSTWPPEVPAGLGAPGPPLPLGTTWVWDWRTNEGTSFSFNDGFISSSVVVMLMLLLYVCTRIQHVIINICI